MPRAQEPATAEQVTRYADMFSAMGTEARLRIMQLLLTAHPEGLVVSEIQEQLGIPNSTLSHHLDKLRNEDLVRVKRESTFLRYTANHEALQELLQFLYAECCTRSRAVKAKDIVQICRQSLGDSGVREKLLIAMGAEESQRAQRILGGVLTMDNTGIKEVVKQKYGEAALRVTSGASSSCCGAAPAGTSCDPITTNIYDAAQAAQIPEQALQASLGCGNPTALAELRAGETVLDLGSGGGIDVLLSARRVGLSGKAYGLDMTDEMLALANENKRKAGAQNVEFLKGEIEQIPLPDNSVDVIISNCVINLSADKDKVLREAFRVLRPGGRFAVSDVVTRGQIVPEIRKSVLLWVGCIAGALDEQDYRSKLESAGFAQVEIEPTRIYRMEDAREFLSQQNLDVDALAAQADGKFMSAFVRAVKL